MRSFLLILALSGASLAEEAFPSRKEVLAAVKGLGADTADAREEAFRRLEGWGMKDPGKALELLPRDDPDPEIRMKLEELGTAFRRERLLQPLGLKDERLRESALAFLAAPSMQTMFAFVGGPGAERKDEVRRACAVLLGHPDPGIRQICIRGLGTLRDASSFPLLRPLMKDPVPEVRASAAMSLGAMKDKESAPAFLGLLEDGDPEVRGIAAFALGQIGEASAVPGILKVLSENHPRSRTTALAALGQLKAKEALPAILGYLKGEAADARVAALTALGSMGDPGTADAVAEFLDDPSPGLPEYAASTLGRILGKPWKQDAAGLAQAREWRRKSAGR